ncbi:MAG: hypothetical protein ACI4VF_03780 [Lachnospirales bacterium]
MFQKTKVVNYRNIIEGFFNAKCDVYEYNKNLNGSITKFSPVVVEKDLPCRRGYCVGGAVNYVKTGEKGVDNTGIKQYVKLFIPFDKIIKEGSLIKVKFGGCDEFYEYSGKTLVYETHCEVLLRAVERWA